MKRYHVLDEIRGLTLVSMILYHASWDMVYIFHRNWIWYESAVGYVWQQSICWTFILLSGFCWSLGREKLKRGGMVFGGGMLVTTVTLLFMPQNRVVFGVLTLLGSCMLLMIPLHKILKKVHPLIGLGVSAVFFVVFREITNGFLWYIGADGWKRYRMPDCLYRNYITAYFGMPHDSFFSTDYFPVFPWIFLFLIGYFLYRIAEKKALFKYLLPQRLKAAGWIGRHSFPIYLLHQPIVYTALSVYHFLAEILMDG